MHVVRDDWTLPWPVVPALRILTPAGSGVKQGRCLIFGAPVGARSMRL